MWGRAATPATAGGDCEPGVNTDGTYNLQFINDFIRNGMKQQILLSKAVTETYYAMKPAYNYWNGCSTGGRQGYVLAQELPTELDGILANAPAIYWTRFQTAQMWGQIVDEGPRRRPDRGGQAEPGHSLGRRRVRRGGRCHRWRDRRSAHMPVSARWRTSAARRPHRRPTA